MRGVRVRRDMMFAAVLVVLWFRGGYASPSIEPIPEATRKVAPNYPDSARRAGIQGTVLVQALVGRDGRVKEARVVRRVSGLDDAAVAAVRQWEFKPATSNEKPVSVWVAVPLRFGPGEGSSYEDSVSAPIPVWAVVVRPDSSLSLMERIAFYVARLGDSTFIEYGWHGEPRTRLVAPEELGAIGAPALPLLVQALECSRDVYERTQIFYTLRQAAQGPGTEDAAAQADLQTILRRFPLALPPESQHASLKAAWLGWWRNHRERLRCVLR